MGRTVGIRELKQNPSAVLAEVKNGEVVTITERGVPIARIVPAALSPLEEMIASGEVRVPNGKLSEALDQITPIPRAPGEKTSQEWLDWSRGYTDDE
jgi:prevent-host-death family protein